MSKIFISVFAKEFEDYLAFIQKSNKTIKHVRSVLKRFDCFLVSQDICEKKLPKSLIYQWISSQQVKNITKKTILRRLIGFLKYLVAMGYKNIEFPEVPKADSSEYVPHIFSEDEFLRIINFVDCYSEKTLNTQMVVVLPVLIRLLYSSGIRLGEALLLRWCDIVLEDGIIRILLGKNLKQRQIPLSHSMSNLLRIFRSSVFFKSDKDYLFANKHGKPYSQTAIQNNFAKILKLADIPNIKTQKFERGVCLHCFRHTFVVHSFLQADLEGRSFEESVPYISTYLGHESIMETDKYLRANYLMYTSEHEKINEYTNSVFPEVIF